MPTGLDTAARTAARVAAIRAPYPGTDTLSPRRGSAGAQPESAEALAPVVHLADRAPRPARDGAARDAHAPRIDAQNRVNLGKALAALGWTPQTFLVAAPERGHVVVRAEADSPLLTRVPVDADRRLTLPPAVLAILDVRPGDQVLAGAVLDTGELHLFAVADALQMLTGPLATPAAPLPAPHPAAGSRITPRWQPDSGGPNR